jgi:signal transduction histidine kinase
VADVRLLGAHGAGLVLQLQRSVPLVYQLEKISAILAAATARALEDRRPFTSTNLGRGGDGHLYLIRSRLEVGRRGEDSSLIMQVVSRVDEEELTSFALRKETEADGVAEAVRLLERGAGVADTAKDLLPCLLELTGMEAGGVLLLTSDAQAHVVTAYGPTRGRGSEYPPLSLDEPVIRALLARPRVAQFSGQAPLPDAVVSLVCRDHGCVVVAPAVAVSAVTAFFVMSRQRSGPLALDELEAIDVVREAFGLLVRNRSLDEMSQHAEPILQTAYTVSKAISGRLNLERTFSEIAVHAARVIGGSHCLLLELDQSSHEFFSVASSDGLGEELIGMQYGFEEVGGARQDLLHGKSFQVQDHAWSRGDDHTFMRRLGVKSALVVPMFAQNDLIGALLLYSSGDRVRYSDAEVSHAEAVAEQAAIAIHNARLYRGLTHSQNRIQSLLTRLNTTREQERQRFAQLVHDDIVQSIVAAVYRLDAFRRLVEVEHTEEFDESVDVLRRAILDARRVIWEMRPPVLDGLGLTEALEALATHSVSGDEAQLHVDCDVVPDMSDAVSTAVYRMAREALLNAQRHAGAKNIWLSLAADQSNGVPAVRLRVEDDGLGFDTSAQVSEDHYGHAMIDEQASVLGGSVVIESELGRGTRVDVLVPTSGGILERSVQ